jgi:hypothetical protein
MKKQYLIQILVLLLATQCCSIAQTNIQYRKSKIAEVHSKDLLLIFDSIIDVEHNKCTYYNDSTMYIVTMKQSGKNQKLTIESIENCFFDSLCSSFVYKNHVFQFDKTDLMLELNFYSISNYWMFYNINIEEYGSYIDEFDDSRSIFTYQYINAGFIREKWCPCAQPCEDNSSSPAGAH